MTIKTLFKMTALAGLLAWALPAHAGKFSDLQIFPSSGSYHIGYPDGSGSLTPAKGRDAVLTSSGAAVVQSTSATAAHRPFRVKNDAGTDVLGVRQDGTTVGTFSGALTGNAATASALAANGANCSAGNYPLGVDASGAVEGCTAAGIGDVVSSNSNNFVTPATIQTFGSSVTLKGRTQIDHLVGAAKSSHTWQINGASGNDNRALGACIDPAVGDSSATITASGLYPIRVKVKVLWGAGVSSQLAWLGVQCNGSYAGSGFSASDGCDQRQFTNGTDSLECEVKFPAPAAGSYSCCPAIASDTNVISGSLARKSYTIVEEDR